VLEETLAIGGVSTSKHRIVRKGRYAVAVTAA